MILLSASLLPLHRIFGSASLRVFLVTASHIYSVYSEVGLRNVLVFNDISCVPVLTNGQFCQCTYSRESSGEHNELTDFIYS